MVSIFCCFGKWYFDGSQNRGRNLSRGPALSSWYVPQRGIAISAITWMNEWMVLDGHLDALGWDVFPQNPSVTLTAHTVNIPSVVHHRQLLLCHTWLMNYITVCCTFFVNRSSLSFHYFRSRSPSDLINRFRPLDVNVWLLTVSKRGICWRAFVFQEVTLKLRTSVHLTTAAT